jgi:transcriptional regulator with XRE-family HTH domain
VSECQALSQARPRRPCGRSHVPKPIGSVSLLQGKLDLPFKSSMTYGAADKRLLHNEHMATELWQRIKAAREAVGATQNDIAEACSISRNSVSMWESSEPKNRTAPTLANLISLAKLAAKKFHRPLSHVAGWLIDDASNLPPDWVDAADVPDAKETVATKLEAPQSKRGKRLVTHFERLTPAVQAHVLGIVEALAMPASPEYEQWESEQRDFVHSRKAGEPTDDRPRRALRAQDSNSAGKKNAKK